MFLCTLHAVFVDLSVIMELMVYYLYPKCICLFLLLILSGDADDNAGRGANSGDDSKYTRSFLLLILSGDADGDGGRGADSGGGNNGDGGRSDGGGKDVM